MTLLGIRITADADDLLLEFTRQYIGLWCKEGGDLEKYCTKPHYHGIVDTTLTPNGLRKQIYNIFDVPKDKRGQRFCAFTKIKDEEGFQRYICKGTENTLPLILQNNFDIDINDRYTQYWDINSQFKAEAEARKTAKKTNKANFKDWFINNYLTEINDCTRRRLSKRNIALKMYEYYVENEWELPSPSQGEIIINDLYLRFICPDEKLKDKISEYWRIFD